MKKLLLLATVFGLVSCNTTIGVWRDTKALSSWSVRKIQEANSGGGDTADQEYEYGAPVY
ncbi:MAG: hypothetical protein NWT08_03910 [Akkermansiaceae bacterium]|jgi:predicted small secreted protein|nr:hypothetical protein [Akkermansiaceae bacterium]MDP4646783.1 hypothetical protein [Akkermansiaceae bacterium]MDP4720017.1 hypothetical protein [Akkermansiaceae bacterium]MDP4779699.1 hypothetical protein [Akkermansiaceae bacterium]MDP4846642.1 hypothetical protein [Akkermansiaceae bacterium]